MKRFLTLVASLFAISALNAAAPSGYYSSLDGKSGEALKNQLHDIIAPHTQLTYSSLWNYFPQTDAYPEHVRYVLRQLEYSSILLLWRHERS